MTEPEVLAAAFEVLSSGGPAAVSIRSVAAGLGISPNSVYTYFPSKAALLQGMAEELLAELRPPQRGRPAAPRQQLITLADRVRRRLLARPGAIAVIMSAPLTGPNALRLGEDLIAIFVEAGLSVADAARASYAFQVQVLGSIALAEAGPAERSVPELTGFPLTEQGWPVIAGYDSAAQFRWTVRQLLNGLIGPAAGATVAS
ncbi:TetR/AcrR family transcriptional regulator [Microlunatus sp. GCM10028923]|uniref:TetR/AcrR family transcriptional regulator n=1 Tax=Microlunatus sp. GCM10028923 TaxID=3273400 RepID=UPI003621C10A